MIGHNFIYGIYEDNSGSDSRRSHAHTCMGIQGERTADAIEEGL